MGGCFSMLEPANGRPRQANATPREKSMCQSILDLFKKCGFSRRDVGGPDDSINIIQDRIKHFDMISSIKDSDAQVQKAKDITKKSELEMEKIESQKERVRERFDEINSIINKSTISALNQFESGDPSEAGGTDTDDSTV